MGTVGGGELLVVLLCALIVLGPQKLPEAARQLARIAGELRRVSVGFQRELREALAEPQPRIDDPPSTGHAPQAPAGAADPAGQAAVRPGCEQAAQTEQR